VVPPLHPGSSVRCPALVSRRSATSLLGPRLARSKRRGLRLASGLADTL
jgi:hypothetical protein